MSNRRALATAKPASTTPPMRRTAGFGTRATDLVLDVLDLRRRLGRALRQQQQDGAEREQHGDHGFDGQLGQQLQQPAAVTAIRTWVRKAPLTPSQTQRAR